MDRIEDRAWVRVWVLGRAWRLETLGMGWVRVWGSACVRVWGRAWGVIKCG